MIWVRALLGGNGLLAAALASVIAFLGWTYAQRSIGRSEGANAVVSKIEKQTERINVKAKKARDSARAPGSVSRVRNSYCRDCD